MPRVRMVTNMAGPDGVAHSGSVVNVSREEARDLLAGGYAVPVEQADDRPAEDASSRGRRGASRAVSGPDENA